MGFSRCLLSSVALEPPYNLITLWYGIIGITLCLLISICSYTKIFLILRHHNSQIQNHVQQPNQSNQLNIARYKKAVSTAIAVITVAPAVKYSFVSKGMQTRRTGQHKAKLTLSARLHVKPLITVITAIWLQLTLVICYLPFSIVEAFKANVGLSASVYHCLMYAGALAYLNSSLNPILYYWKIEEVRQAAKDTIRQVLCNVL